MSAAGAQQPASTAARQRQVSAADSLFNAQKWAEARASYVRILESDPLDSWSAFRGALSAEFTGDSRTAAAELLRVAQTVPTRRAQALWYRARALSELGQHDSAMTSLQGAIDAGFLSVGLLTTTSEFDSLRAMPAFIALTRRIFGPHYGEPAPGGSPSPEQMRQGFHEMVATVRARHPNPFRYLSPQQWDAEERALVAAAGAMNEAQYLVQLMRLASNIGDVHSSSFPGPKSRLMRYALPVTFWKFPEGLFIRAADSTQRELLGAQVIAINGVNIDTLWPRLIREFPYENEWMSAAEIGFFLHFPDFLRGLGLGTDSTQSSLTLKMPDGSNRTILVHGRDRGYSVESNETRGFTVPKGWIEAGPNALPLWLRNRATNYWLASLPDKKTLYMQFNVPRDDARRPWAAFLDTLVATIRRDHVERLVIDLRHNGGGFGPMGSELAWKLHEVPEVNRPGHLFVALSRITQSAGVVIAAELEHNAHAVFVGEPLAAHPNFFNGRQGNHVPLNLPGTGILFRVSEMSEQNSYVLDNRRFIAPDIPAPLTWAAFVAGRDPVMDAILTIEPATAARLLDDAGGRALSPYARWQRPTQYEAFGGAMSHRIP